MRDGRRGEKGWEKGSEGVVREGERERERDGLKKRERIILKPCNG